MRTRIAELRWKEVIGMGDGSRFGFVEDLEVDVESGQVRSLVLPGRRRLFGLLGREEDRYIPWESVRRFGEDAILVEHAPSPARPAGAVGKLSFSPDKRVRTFFAKIGNETGKNPGNYLQPGLSYDILPGHHAWEC